MMKAFALLLAAILPACAEGTPYRRSEMRATPYGNRGVTGGYSESRVNEHLIKVTVVGNWFATVDEAQAYALYRCAEISRDSKKPYFVIYRSLIAAARNTPSSQPGVGVFAKGVGAFGKVVVASAFLSIEDAYRSGALKTDSTLNELAPEVGRATSAGK